MRRLLGFVFKQHKTGIWWGGVKQSISQIGFYITFVNLFLLCITAYDTGFIQEHVLDVNFIQFMIIIVVILLVALISVYKVDTPSYFGFLNKQYWENYNPQRAYLEKMQSTIESLVKEVQELKKQNEAKK